MSAARAAGFYDFDALMRERDEELDKLRVRSLGGA